MKKKVMIVDDDPGVRETLTLYLAAEGFDTTAATGGSQCLENLAKGFSGVILMDVMMPVMDGWDTIREIVNKGFGEHNLIIMLTAKMEPDEKMEGLKEYVLDYVTKPCDLKKLAAMIREYFKYLEE